MADEPRLRIEDAARAAGLSTRNLRAYQSFGLVPPPHLEGRVGRYGPEHLARLRSVRRLQAQGFSLAGIRALFAAHARGLSLAALVGAEPSALEDAPAPEAPRSLRLALVPGPLTPSVAREASQN
jgi:DNA-binding transcriptional MerR regulator